MSAVESRLIVLLGAALVAACGARASADPGLDALMFVQDAQFEPGALAASGGPRVEGLDLRTNTIWPGQPNKLVRGTLAQGATAVAVQLRGDRGHWIVRAGPPDVSTPKLPTFRCVASFSRELEAGTAALDLRAVNADGESGALLRRTLTVLDAAPSLAVAESALAVRLAWDNAADLDLHVVDPLDQEVFHGAPTTLDAFAPSSEQSEFGPGVLDADSNADCVLDGRREETVRWASEPPPGKYRVRVDTKSLCGRPIAYFSVSVELSGERIAETSGVGLDADTALEHGRGAGLLVLELDVP